jgi:hypothetical protein
MRIAEIQQSNPAAAVDLPLVYSPGHFFGLNPSLDRFSFTLADVALWVLLYLSFGRAAGVAFYFIPNELNYILR